MCRGDENVVALLVDYYTGLFTISNPCEIDSILQQVQQNVIEEMNTLLGHEFTRKEINLALSQMAPLKAPGPDRMPPIFSNTIGSDVATAVLSCLNTAHIPTGINHTYLTLIPK